MLLCSCACVCLCVCVCTLQGTHAELQEAIRLSGKSIMWTHPPLKHHTYSFFKKADEWPTELLALPRIVASFQADPVQTLRDSRSVKR